MLSACTAVELQMGLGGGVACSCVAKAALSNHDVKYFQCCMATLFPSPVVKFMNGHKFSQSLSVLEAYRVLSCVFTLLLLLHVSLREK